ncbi:MAG: alcohol dehydrogenase catalytic domain-containing protein [Lachnospiraceae bacterium]|nr:alcohol dehydrogenase catalytic domain-containing protein [Lachnospiraceae bacterium]
MLNTIYQLVRPRQFEVAFEDITIDQEHILVRPTHLSICNADERYYQGTRGMEILQQKLPMALIHEGIGKVVHDPAGMYPVGTRVVMIPNVPMETDEVTAENYLRTSRFRGSSMHGFMQEYIQTTADRLIPLPEGMNDLVAAFTEMISVCYHGISRFDTTAHSRREAVGVWGDGNMGYLTALLLKMRFPQTKVYVFGVTDTKLSDFTFADETWRISEIPEELQIDHGFECVGGSASGRAINQMIDHLNPEGTIGIFGVSEDLVPINTRMILEKGLKVLGTSRSGRADFLGLFELYQKQPEVLEYLEKLIGAVVPVRGIPDMVEAFEMDIHKIMGKTVMVWE